VKKCLENLLKIVDRWNTLVDAETALVHEDSKSTKEAYKALNATSRCTSKHRLAVQDLRIISLGILTVVKTIAVLAHSE